METPNTITVTRLYELLSQKIGKDGAENLTAYIRQEMQTEIQHKEVATKTDIANLRSEIGRDINGLLKWIIVISATQLAALVAFIAMMK